MGLKATMFSDATPPVAVELCASPDPLPHHNLTINHVRIIDVVSLYEASFKRFYDRQNRENTVSFDVVRTKDTAGRAFRGPVGALKFFIQHTQAMPGIGRLRLDILDEAENLTVWLTGCVVPRLQLARNTGVRLDLRYEITGRDFSFNNPALA